MKRSIFNLTNRIKLYVECWDKIRKIQVFFYNVKIIIQKYRLI